MASPLTLSVYKAQIKHSGGHVELQSCSSQRVAHFWWFSTSPSSSEPEEITISSVTLVCVVVVVEEEEGFSFEMGEEGGVETRLMNGFASHLFRFSLRITFLKLWGGEEDWVVVVVLELLLLLFSSSLSSINVTTSVSIFDCKGWKKGV